MVNEEVVRDWLLHHCGDILRAAINESNKYDYDFTNVVSFFNQKSVREKKYK